MRRTLRQICCSAAAAAAAAIVAGCGSGGSAGGSGAPVANSAHGGGQTSLAPRQVERLALPAHVQVRTVRVPILTYHRVHLFATELHKSILDLTIEPAAFAAELDALAAGGYHTITQAQLFHALFDGAPLPSRPVLISVDDGYVDDVTNILPQLRRRHMVATFYVITGRFHEQGFLNEAQVRELDDAGMDIGAHSRTHVPLNAIPTAQMVSEIPGSRRDLQRVLGHFVYFFAYPYGAYNAAVLAEVRKAGFLLATTTAGGTTETSSAPLVMPRIHVGRTATPASVLASVRGG